MKTVWICLALFLAAAHARELTTCSRYHTEYGYRVVDDNRPCGGKYCPHGYYCKRTAEYGCEYYAHGKCPSYAVEEPKCELYVTKCGDKKCKYDEKCDVKKECKTEYREVYGHGHPTTQEIKTCWDEHVCVKADPPKKCVVEAKYSCCDPYASDYGSHEGYKYYAVKGHDSKCKCGYGQLCIKADVKKCYIDPKYAAIHAGASCGSKKCGRGYYCKHACKYCGYKEVSPKCAKVETYKPVPCGPTYCSAHQYCDVKPKKVCGDASGYHDGYQTGYEGGYYYYYYEEGSYRSGYYGYHGGSGGYGSGSHGSRSGSGSGSHGSRGGSGSGSKSPAKSPEKTPSPSTSPSSVNAQVASVSTPTTAGTAGTVDAVGDTEVTLGASASNPVAASILGIGVSGNTSAIQSATAALPGGTATSAGAVSRVLG